MNRPRLSGRWTAPGAALLLALAACDAGGGARAAKDAGAAAAPDVCIIAVRAVDLPVELKESSGIAPSRRNPGVWWSHNDSGGDAVLFAMDGAARTAGQVRVTGARNRDWEDIAVGPCAAGSCVFLGDIGNNTGRKRPLALYRVPEPGPGDTATAPAERFEAFFPNGRPDAEALFVLPDSSVYLVTKGNTDDDPIDLYRWPTPLRTGPPVTLERVRTLAPHPEQPGDYVTGASASPDGRWVAIRSYSTLAFFRTADLLGSGQPAVQMDLLPLAETQGEGVSLSDDGTVMLTSEGGGHHLPGTADRLACRL
ncbi:MAG TPA: hypothetical protein VFQ39_07890, partial [Longimicrobium sp.]|nr:hypothetical protein [Longimicrobium sp.]